MDHTCAMSGEPQQFIFENRHKGTPWGQGVSWLGGSVAAGGKGRQAPLCSRKHPRVIRCLLGQLVPCQCSET